MHEYISMAVSLQLDSVLFFVDLIPYLVFESMSATDTSPKNVVVVLHGRNTNSQQIL